MKENKLIIGIVILIIVILILVIGIIAFNKYQSSDDTLLMINNSINYTNSPNSSSTPVSGELCPICGEKYLKEHDTVHTDGTGHSQLEWDRWYYKNDYSDYNPDVDSSSDDDNVYVDSVVMLMTLMEVEMTI